MKRWRIRPLCARLCLAMSALDIPSVIDVTSEAEPVLLRLVPALAGLGPNALTILAEIAERLQRGARQYKNDLDDGRNWRDEAHEEALDYLVYMTRAHVEERQQRAADAQRQAAAIRLDDETLRLRDHSRLDPRDGEAPTEHDACGNCDTPGVFCRGEWLKMRKCCPDCTHGEAPTWPLKTPGEDWEKTRDGCG